MDTLRDRLAAGLDYKSYIEEMEAVHAAYDKLPVEKLAAGCLARSGVPGEKAFNAYIAAANVWGDCIAEPGCETSSIEARLQKKWRGASHFLSAAESSTAQVGDQR